MSSDNSRKRERCTTNMQRKQIWQTQTSTINRNGAVQFLFLMPTPSKNSIEQVCISSTCSSDKIANGGYGFTICRNGACSTWADLSPLARFVMTSVHPEPGESSFCPKIRALPRQAERRGRKWQTVRKPWSRHPTHQRNTHHSYSMESMAQLPSRHLHRHGTSSSDAIRAF